MVDLEFIRWVADQVEEVGQKVAPLVAALLKVDQTKVLSFIDYVRNATEAVLNALDMFLKFPVVFGAPGDGLTDAEGNLCPDCPCPEHEAIVFALKAQQLAS